LIQAKEDLMYYQFGQYLVDTDNYKITKRDQFLSDDSKSIQLLSLLCDNYPNVLDKDYLIEQLWQGHVVTDSSLSKLISDIRKLIEIKGDDTCYIKTVRGSGFRFNVEVKISTTKPSTLSSQNKTLSYLTKIVSQLKKRLTKPVLWSLTALLLFTAYLLHDLPAFNKHGTNLSNIRHPDRSIRVAVLPVKSEKTPINEWIKYGVMSMTTDQLNSYSSIHTIPSATVIAVTQNMDPSLSIKKNYKKYFEVLCGQIGCDHIISIEYALDANNSPILSYHIYDSNQRTSFNHFASNDVIYATAQMMDSLIRDLLPSQTNKISLSDTYSSDTKANRDYAIGVHELLNGDPVSAMSYLKLALSKEPDFFWAKARLAEANYQNGQLEKASKIIAQLDQNNTSAKRHYFLQHLYSNILYSLGDLNASLKLSLSLQNNVYVQKNSLLLGNELLNIGSSYQATNKLAKAEDYLKKSIQEYTQAGYGSGRAKALFNLGNVYLSMSKEQQAVDYYKQSLELFIRFGMTGYRLMAKHQIASTSIWLGQTKFAKTELLKLIDDYKNIGSIEGELTVMTDLITLNISTKSYQSAEKLVQQLAPRLETSELYYIKDYFNKLAVVVYLNLSEVNKAQDYFNRIKNQWKDTRPAFAFIPAHLQLAQGHIKQALEIANQVKKDLAEKWSDAHQKVLDQFVLADKQNKVIRITY